MLTYKQFMVCMPAAGKRAANMSIIASLNKLDEVASKANGILRVRIYGILRDIQQSNFFHLSSTESTDIEAFIGTVLSKRS